MLLMLNHEKFIICALSSNVLYQKWTQDWKLVDVIVCSYFVYFSGEKWKKWCNLMYCCLSEPRFIHQFDWNYIFFAENTLTIIIN